MHKDILSWPNEAIYNGRIQLPKAPPTTKSRSTAAYSVFQVNTIEDIEIDFLAQYLKYYVSHIDRHRSASIGIICGHPATGEQLKDKIKFVQFLRSIFLGNFLVN